MARQPVTLYVGSDSTGVHEVGAHEGVPGDAVSAVPTTHSGIGRKISSPSRTPVRSGLVALGLTVEAVILRRREHCQHPPTEWRALAPGCSDETGTRAFLAIGSETRTRSRSWQPLRGFTHLEHGRAPPCPPLRRKLERLTPVRQHGGGYPRLHQALPAAPPAGVPRRAGPLP
jgi:hypothetical protein